MRLSTLNVGLISSTLLAAAVPTYAAIDYSTNIALVSAGGTGRIGYATANNGSAGTAYGNTSAAGGGLQNNIVDGTTGSRTDTFMIDKDFAVGGFYDFAGVGWATTKNNVASVRFYMNTFPDGGWFDRPSLSGSTDFDTLKSGSGTGGTANNISIDPKIQYTVDGTTWIDVTGSSSDYNAVITSGTGTAQTLTAPITFTFTPVSGILGIRVFGDGADVDNTVGSNQAGFISVAEFQVFVDPVPEPATLGLLSIGAMGVLRRRRH